MGRRTTRALAALTLTALVGLSAGCGDDGGGSDGGADEPVVVEITFEDGQVTPNGERVEVEAGQPIDLEVTADARGSIHVHSDPEHEFAFEEGTDTFEMQIDRPGVVEVESHELEQVIVQLEVR